MGKKSSSQTQTFDFRIGYATRFLLGYKRGIPGEKIFRKKENNSEKAKK